MKSIGKISIALILVCILCTITGCNKKEEKVVLNIEGMTDLQKAVVITAESYYLRGNAAQYDMGKLYDSGYGGSIERRHTGLNSPEDYSSQYMDYTDCSGFVFDVYLEALGIKIIESSPWTKTYCESIDNIVLKEEPAEWPEDVDVAKKLKEFESTLQPGDIMVYRYEGNASGHAMLYVGNGMMIHSGGVSFSFKEGQEKYEEEGTYRYEPIADSLFNPEHRRYLAKHAVYVIVRPIDGFKDEIPERTLSRMNEMRGIKAEKLASCTYGQTANLNSEITYTFRLENKSNINKKLTITDTVPKYTKYVSGADKRDGDKLSWKVNVPANETVEVSYKVKVSADALGKKISSESFVSSIAVNCSEILVAKTLTKDEQAELVKKLDNAKKSQQVGTMLVNEIYGKDIFTMRTAESMWDAVIDAWSVTLGEGLELSNIVVPRLYGGRKVGEFDKDGISAQIRTRYIREDLLIIGDIVAIDEKLYIFTGEKLFDLGNKEETDTEILQNIIAADRFIVLRPSMGF